MSTTPLPPSGSEFERVDDTPVELPTRLRLPQSRTDQIRQFIREEMSRASASQGHETFEEADDVEPDDDDHLPLSRYEMNDLEPPAPFEPPTPPKDVVKAEGQPPVDPAASPKEPKSANFGGSDGTK